MFTNHLFRQYSPHPAVLTDQGVSYSYKELSVSASELYAHIGHRCLVFCLCRNTIESLTGYVSFLSNQVIPVMLDASLDTSLLENLIDVYAPEYLWLPSENAPSVKESAVIFSSGSYSLLKLNHNILYPLHPDLALLLTTSGSTGSPRLVRLSENNILSNADSIAQYLGITSSERPITTLPMHYSFGLSVINSHLLKGATLLLTGKSLVEKEFWSFLKNQQATSLSGVPYTFEILKKLRFFRMDLPSLKTLAQAGGKLDIELNREFAQFCRDAGKKFFVMYGQTEATARMSYLPPEFSLTKTGSIGNAIPGGKFSLIGENGEEITNPETVGELVYQGPNVSMGYAENSEDLQKGDEDQRILLTGDLARKDENDFYYITGRNNRFIKIFGNRINLEEIEQLLKNIVADCACGGSDDHLVIYLTDKSGKQEILNYLVSKTGIQPQTINLTILDTIPRNPSGKILYSQLS